MSEAVVTSGLTKDYRSGRGIFDCDLEVHEGEIFGFLGPNGAGKTTVIRLLMGLIRATRGEATVFGRNCATQATAVGAAVGEEGVEPSRSFEHKNLNLARMPVPPLAQAGGYSILSLSSSSSVDR